MEAELNESDKKLPTRVETPMSSGYHPELDISPELNNANTNYYQELIGILR